MIISSLIASHLNHRIIDDKFKHREIDCIIVRNFLINSVLYFTANSQVVDLVLLRGSYFLVVKRHAYFTIWRYRRENHGVWRNQNSSSLSERLFWISPQSFTSCCCNVDSVPYCFCFPFCILYWEIELSKEVEISTISMMVTCSHQFLVWPKCLSNNVL